MGDHKTISQLSTFTGHLYPVTVMKVENWIYNKKVLKNQRSEKNVLIGRGTPDSCWTGHTLHCEN
ncbi:uncharacterized protein Dmul_21570 [Desulfococcus multivorans]|nr:uncharacterized protein Dmul_21570 [Desulfococcus multivorans]